MDSRGSSMNTAGADEISGGSRETARKRCQAPGEQWTDSIAAINECQCNGTRGALSIDALRCFRGLLIVTHYR